MSLAKSRKPIPAAASAAAVRFSCRGPRLSARPSCHCRMCQKADGHFYAPLVLVRGCQARPGRAANRSVFQFVEPMCSAASVRIAARRLTFRGRPDGRGPDLSALSDQPEYLAPLFWQWGISTKSCPYVDGLAGLPGHETMDGNRRRAVLDDLVSYQHPDHDTETWPPQGKA